MDTINEIKQKIDIVDLVGSYVSLKKAGRNYKGVCPFHSENTPSFMVSPELQIYKCFGCGEAGDIFKFVEKIEGIEFSAALEQLAVKAGIKLEKKDYDPESAKRKELYQINNLTAKYYHYVLTKHPEGKAGLDYLTQKRKLTSETIDFFQMGYAPDTWAALHNFLKKQGIHENEMLDAGVISEKTSGEGYIDRFRGRIVFPFKGIDGNTVGFNGRTILDREPKYLNTSETAVFHKSIFLFNLVNAKIDIKKHGAVIVEGQMDVISAYQEGIKNIVASSGTALAESQLKILQRYTNDLTFCFDADSAGVNAVYRAVEIAERMGFNIKVAVIPAPFKDLDEVLKADPEKAKIAIRDAVDVYDFYISSTLKANSKESALGKKLILEALVPVFSKINNPVIVDHYSKMLATELGLSEDTVTTMFKGGSLGEYSNSTEEDQKLPLLSRDNPEGYFLALLLKADIDIMREYAYKMDVEDFINPIVVNIYEALVAYLKEDRKSFNIKQVIKKAEEGHHDNISELYLWDFDGIIEV
ncbi:DNA primase, partial [candidate division WWE3 bacterium RIFOXYD1_FULL_43_17]